VDRAIDRYLRTEVPLDERAVDVSFDAPDRTWGAGLTRPTVNVFLWEIISSEALRTGGLEERHNAVGAVERRLPTPQVELHYLVTAWTNEQRDEHQLLGSVLTAVLAKPELPEGTLPEPLPKGRYGVALASRDKRPPADFWSALDGRLKPGLQLAVTMPLDAFAWQPTATPADTVSVAAEQTKRPDPSTTPARQDEQPVLRRRRANGALVMEGRRQAGDDDDA
jgi:hypothetical protein